MRKIYSYKDNGFSLIELLVVLAGLSILSSLALNNIVKSIDYAKVDEAKALLNTAAAECLQGLRREGEDFLTRDLSDAKDEMGNDLPDILSAKQLEKTGYGFSPDYKRCENASIKAISDYDSSRRYPGLSFSINPDGKLNKCATDDGSDTQVAAESWAGGCVTKGQALIECQEHDAAVRKSKTECIAGMDSWLANPVNRGKFDRAWNDKADSNCPEGPPKPEEGDDECTPDGCNQTIYGYEGIIVSTGNDDKAKKKYDDYVEIQKGKDCAAALKKLRDENTHTTLDGTIVGMCGNDVYWFYRGNEVSLETWKSNMCSENKQALLSTLHSGPVEHCDISPIYICGGEEILEHGDREQAKAFFETCLAENKDAQCTQALNEDAKTKGKGGPYTSPTPEDMEPIVGENCAEQYYYCPTSGKVYLGADASEEYDADESCQAPDVNCGARPKKCKKQKNMSKPECAPYAGCP